MVTRARHTGWRWRRDRTSDKHTRVRYTLGMRRVFAFLAQTILTSALSAVGQTLGEALGERLSKKSGDGDKDKVDDDKKEGV